MIDWSRVQELREEVGEEDFEEVVDLFLVEVDSVIDRLKTMADRSTLGSDLHFLKGSALSLGFSAFSKLCHQGERDVSDGQQDEIDLAPVYAVYDASRTKFLSEYKRRDGL
ncbi:Hpt protein [Sulfitobacter noctilucicola]|uniref:HPt (Histidine-containing phosphotransfer) domain-containing protein n=1 Tax=Sulfitobacter noctilucicola TaxID=1342301 RepID=A0A7W6M576_9RHOB|nr:Hpt domain-containing protein [Sulfitobacter noctilucicola]KIN62806.1 Hpt protein [Sulfitobacter noctilucicola]MBB4172663.1 HPt (histidine-containing phosphotransfer) domain-containing protein [Sulfitobacter noctilucicola]